MKNPIPYKPQQSPIDLGLANPVAALFPPGYLTLRWAGPLDGKPEGGPGHITFVFETPEDVGLDLGGTFFRLLQLHFHAPSEHKVGRKGWPLEVHVVHQNPKSKLLAVLGIMVEAGVGSQGGSRFFEAFAERYSAKETSPPPMSIDPRDLLPQNRGDFYRYEGSLTTNPDEDNPETVSWAIFREPLRVDQAALRKFIKLGHRAKKVQDHHRRFVLTSFIPPQ